jgi:leader peptidase (prepilin peptidase) / N-methyltransferase
MNLTVTMVGVVLLAVVATGWLLPLIDRLPQRDPAEREPLLAAPRCRHCDAEQGWAARVPFGVRRCHACGEMPHRRELSVLAVSASVLAALAWRFGPSVELLPYLFLGLVLVLVSFIDLDTLRIPDRLTFPSLVIAVPTCVLIAVSTNQTNTLVGAAVGAVAFFGILLLFNLVYPAGMGFGDVKLGLLLGWFLGWVSPFLVVHALLVASLLGTIVGVAVIVITRDRKTAFPFGPMLCAGTLIALIASNALLPS